MRILALDVGDRRIGVALSDPLGIAAAPLTTIDRAGRRDEVAAVVELAEDHEVVQIAVGMPLTLSGEIGHQASKVQDFIGLLAAQTDLPVFTLDERYSSVEAERLLRSTGKSSRKRNRGLVDSTAAALILQGYLDSSARSRAETSR